MDGPTMMAGGGWVAGSAVVEIGADLSPLEAGLARAQAMVAGFAGQGASVPLGGGVAGGGMFTAAPASPLGGVSMGGGAGLPSAPMPNAQFAGFAGLPQAPYQSSGEGYGGGSGGSDMSRFFRNMRAVAYVGLGVAAVGRAGNAIGSTMYEYDYLATHPGEALGGYDYAHAGDGYTPATQFLAGQSQDIDFALARRKATQEVPILGALARFGDFGPGSTTDLKRQQELLQQQSRGLAGTAQLQFQVAGLAARNSGDPVAEARAGFAPQIAGAEKDQRDAISRMTDYSIAHGDAIDAGGSAKDAFMGLVSAVREAGQALDGLKAQANTATAGIAVQQANQTAIIRAGTNATVASVDGGLGAQAAAHLGILDANTGSAVSDYILHPTARNLATAQGAFATGEAFRAESSEGIFRSESRHGLEMSNARFASQWQAQIAGQQFSADVSEYGYSTSIYGLRAARDPFGSARASIAARRAGASGIVGAIQRGMAYGGLDAEENALNAEESFHSQVAGEGYSARVAAAGYAGSYQPLSAQATLSVARARQEIAMASPKDRPGAISAARAELSAQQHLLTDQRGGDVAIDVSGYQAAGMVSAYGIDLTGHGRDVRGASGILQQGANNAGNSPQAQMQKAESLLDAGNKILGQIRDAILGKRSPSFLRS